MHLVLDSSVLIAAVRPAEPDHPDARAFVERLRSAQASGAARAFGPPELWLEVYVVEERLAHGRRAGPAPGAALRRRMRGRRPFANATDLVYLWAAREVDATVVTLDQGMLAYHGVVCDVTRPQHVRLG